MEWKDIPGWEGFYQVSDAGDVRSVDRTIVTRRHGPTRYKGRVLKPSVSAIYKMVQLVDTANRRVQRAYVHDLVLLAFVGPKPKHLEVCHGPAGQLDNALGNLRYDTRAANSLDRKLFGAPYGPSPLRKPPAFSNCDICGARVQVRRDRLHKRHVCKDPACRSELGRRTMANK